MPPAVTIPTQDSERRSRHSAIRRGRHRGAEASQSFSRGFAALGQLALNGVQVSARATDLATGAVLFSVDDHMIWNYRRKLQAISRDRARPSEAPRP